NNIDIISAEAMSMLERLVFPMCGRYSLLTTTEDLVKRYGLNRPEVDYNPAGEIFPTQEAPVIIPLAGKGEGLNNDSYQTRRLVNYRWGFSLPFTSRPIINARGETVDKKRAFQRAFQDKRCLIPATGFFEWQDTGAGKKKFQIILKQQEIFSLAGLFATFQDKDGTSYQAFTIITTEASPRLEQIHNRMPVILSPEDEETWLDRETDLPAVKELIRPYQDSHLAIESDGQQLNLTFPD
ncbi:MAG: SOS response-associated peptidase, partial [Halanaerobium sp.]|nr:SOS response-associated peptidase [Halanaerobium sp.]